MDCQTCRRELSARIDGEAVAERTDHVDTHLDGCASCRAWWTLALRVTQLARVAPADDVPDLSERVAVAWERVSGTTRARRHRLTILRAALGMVASLQLAVTLWAGLAGGHLQTPLHVDREVSAWNLAVAAGLFTVVWQVRRAAGLLPLLVAFQAVIVVFEAIDLARGMTEVAALAPHLVLVPALALLAALARTPEPPGGDGAPDTEKAGTPFARTDTRRSVA
jgi:predicted anti-sigma-YlaC factor YlaD